MSVLISGVHQNRVFSPPDGENCIQFSLLVASVIRVIVDDSYSDFRAPTELYTTEKIVVSCIQDWIKISE